ncbi:oligopeptidase B [Izhakiella australiensis]|uniref:Oligopeptidase B n=1 Tax=Izhakiella australiensis TaxID=1926881 RepID=A0A1S8YNT6_9GAMM|nr:prolyl oligopeptidase family serine peptidase [Izhakiella australiensis]OON40525.1 oligopeptidase B [Izhakiella australiensis]
MMPPKARETPHTMTLHDDTRVDNYYWLRDDHRQRPEVIDYLRAENDYGRAVMSSHQALESSLLNEMIEREAQEVQSVPYVKRGYRYLHRYAQGDEFPLYLRQPADTSTPDEWEILLDANQRAAHSEFYTLEGLSVSPDNQTLAVAEDFLSRRLFGIRFCNLTTGCWYPEVLENVSDEFVWGNDSRVLYYVLKHKQTLLPWQVWRHQVGTSQQDDVLIYEEQDDTFYVSVHKSTSEHFIIIAMQSSTSSEMRLLDAEFHDAIPQVLMARSKDHEYSLDHYDHQFFIRSNRHGKNFGLYRTDEVTAEGWQCLIEPRPHIVLENFSLFRDWLVVEERQRGLTSLRHIHRRSGEAVSIAFDDPAYVTWLAYNPSPETSKLRYGYSSMTTPQTLFELDMDTGERVLLKQTEVKGFDPANYRSEYHWFIMRDGTEVPVSLVYHRDHFHKAKNPLLVYGYGAYGGSMDADFSISRLSLLNRGFVFGIAHIRGGGELGQNWYDAGRMLNKMNSFTDFIDVTVALAKQGYADPDRIYAMGASAGGLLIGAVLNMASDLYHAAVAEVPFVDVVTTMLDASIPLTTGEYQEWGNPNRADEYHYIRQYSPYDNVTAKRYPHLLVTTGLHDSQVQYWEPAKWVAKLRKLKTDDSLLLLCTDMDAGHGGKSGRFKSYEGIALEYAFLIGLARGSLSAAPPAQP